MNNNASLYLVDPFHLSRVPELNITKRTAHRTVNSCRRGRVVWIEKFSREAAATWKHGIDLLLVDGDHAEAAVDRDWNDWGPFVMPGGVVLFHDACLFENGWTTPGYGPVKLTNRLFRNGSTEGWRIAEGIDSLLIVERKSQGQPDPKAVGEGHVDARH